jgi:hypothetical protein
VTATYTQAALGFRVWVVGQGEVLRSIGVGNIAWHRGINIGYCAIHDEPMVDCQCGLYAYHDLTFALQSTQWVAKRFPGQTIVIGALAAQGSVQVHIDGFRAEQAVITGLSLVAGSQTTAQAAAEHYAVPLVRQDQLASIGQQSALPIPLHERPEGQPGRVVQPGLGQNIDRPIWLSLIGGYLAIILIALGLAVFVGQRSISVSDSLLTVEALVAIAVSVMLIAITYGSDLLLSARTKLSTIGIVALASLMLTPTTIMLLDREHHLEIVGDQAQLKTLRQAETRYQAKHHHLTASLVQLTTVDSAVSQLLYSANYRAHLLRDQAANSIRATVTYSGPSISTNTRASSLI